MKSNSKRYFVGVRLDEKDLILLNDGYLKSNTRSREEYLRQLIRKGFIVHVDYKFLDETNMMLNKIGVSINQIAKRVNASGNIHSDEIRTLKEAMDKVWQLQKSYLSKQQFKSQ